MEGLAHKVQMYKVIILTDRNLLWV